MPKSARLTLTWSPRNQHFELHTDGTYKQCFSSGDEQSFTHWLDEHTSFAFVGQSGRLSVLKENRARGSGYWYAYRKQGQRTSKRYLGPSSEVTFARLEELAQFLSIVPSTPSHAHIPDQSVSKHMTTLLSTKLVPPRVPGILVERPHLLHDLNMAWEHPLTLVSSSAGSGKTTLLSAWANQQESLVAWLSLDPLDNDPIRFWTACIAALRRCVHRLGEEAIPLLHSPQSPPLSTVLVTLLNEVYLIEQEITLILDDLHMISHQTIHDSLSFLLDHLPTNLHLILATRTDPELPLSRLRVRGHLLEIRSSDLRFNQQEATCFLVEEMGLPLSEDEVIALQMRTDGWIAGLLLAALFLRKRDEPGAYIKQFTGSHHYLLDYVQQDILARLPAPVQNFLLQTSILTRLNARSCQEVTNGTTLEESQKMLETLERANLFVIRLDEQRQWYSYHGLFREALLSRLQATLPQLVPQLHQRAASYYEGEGEWREAIFHALSAPDYSYAAILIEQAAPAFWLTGEASTVHNWMLALPDVVLREHIPLALSATLRFLNVAHLIAEAVHARMIAQVEQMLSRLQDLLRRQEDFVLSKTEAILLERRLRLLRALIDGRELYKRGDTARLRLLSQELEALPPDEEGNWNMISLSFTILLVITFWEANPSLVERLQQTKQQLREARDNLAMLRVMSWLMQLFVLGGQLHRAYQIYLEMQALIDQFEISTPSEGMAHVYLSKIYYAWNRLGDAEDAANHVIKCGQKRHQIEHMIVGHEALVHIELARGNIDSAWEALQKQETLFEQNKFARHADWLNVARVRFWLEAGRLTEADRWAKQTPFALEEWDPLHKEEMLEFVRVSLAQQRFAQAVKILENIRPYYQPPTDVAMTLEWMALYVVALYQNGEQEQAIHVAARLLAITEPENNIRIYLDPGKPMQEVLQSMQDNPPAIEENNAPLISQFYIARLLAELEPEKKHHALSSGSNPLHQYHIQPASSPDKKELREPLSRQEQRVLQLLVDGHTYAEMAEKLVVSPNTIKTQVSSIYRKLGVSRRVEAITASQRLQIL